MVQDSAGPGVLGLQQQASEGLERGEAAAGLDVQEAVGDLGAATIPLGFCGFLKRRRSADWLPCPADPL
ncbi:hypothetical protein ACIQXA_04700 [Streptomyces massasporeus]|uniref:hypothetical protein n=1 Tax=Streptomyces massasporeus TaxID=67324 RepID=UPI0037FD59F6